VKALRFQLTLAVSNETFAILLFGIGRRK